MDKKDRCEPWCGKKCGRNMGVNVNLGVGGSRRPVGRRIVDGDGDGVRETSLQQG